MLLFPPDAFRALTGIDVAALVNRSLRQIERRVKAWAGVPMRELRAVSRAERAFLAVAASDVESAVNWAQIAADTDYADESHLCRETRRLAHCLQITLSDHSERNAWTLPVAGGLVPMAATCLTSFSSHGQLSVASLTFEPRRQLSDVKATGSHLGKTRCRFSVAAFGGAPDADGPLPGQLVAWRHASFSGLARGRATGGMIPASVADASV